MTEAEKREAARLFVNKWNGRGKEDEDDRSFWFEILQNILGVQNVTDIVQFQKKVIVDGNTKRIDVYIPETKVLIEQKSLGKALDKKGNQSGDISLTAYEQAKRYNDNLPYEEKARWIITSNFAEIWIYDMNTRVPAPVKLHLSELQTKFHMLDFLINEEKKRITEEVELSIKAGELVGKIHDRFQEQYTDPFAVHTQRSLNILCVRLVFLLYAEDVGLFGDDDAFVNFVSQYDPKDIRRALIDLFQVLDTKVEDRDPYLDDELAAFPYVNGGLFQDEHIVIPKITDEIKQTILESALFDWSKISPTIFGAVFESTLNPETRRSGGMHYTSIENIHKVIDPLFLDDLKTEFLDIQKVVVTKDRIRKLEEFQDKLASLTWLDPACGSGNFLTETYISIRRLENEVIRLLLDARKGQVEGQAVFGFSSTNPIKVSISQFYGIEINDFAVTVAKTALWIAESQMMKETEDMIHMNLDFLPLKTNANIVEGNALRIDWNKLISPEDLNFIMGNPPFVGHNVRSQAQKADMDYIFKNIKTDKSDYVICWFYKAALYAYNSPIRIAFVATNSVCQGVSVGIVWKLLFDLGYKIDYAWPTFVWNSEAPDKAHVHVVIIGFSNKDLQRTPRLYISKPPVLCSNINGYLIDAPDICIDRRSTPIADVPKIRVGSLPRSSAFTLTPEEKTKFIKDNPTCEKWIKPYIGSDEFINGKERYCLWLKDADHKELRSCKMVMERVAKVREDRLASPAATTRRTANTPTLFAVDAQPDTDYLIIPQVSSERRRYIPIGFMHPNVIASNLVFVVPNATRYHFGILTSNVHNAWMRATCGRMKSDYRYGGDIVYNNFPWPSTTNEQKSEIEKTAQGILDARVLYPNSSLADLYDPLTMPIELQRAHTANDKAVMKAYGFDIKNMSEADCVAELMKLYQRLTDKEN